MFWWVAIMVAVAIVAWIIGLVMGCIFGFQRCLDRMRQIGRRSGLIEKEIVYKLADLLENEESRKEQ